VRRIHLDVGSAESDFECRKRLQDEVVASVSRFSPGLRWLRHADACREETRP
jgi:hypothetical protein